MKMVRATGVERERILTKTLFSACLGEGDGVKFISTKVFDKINAKF